MDFNEFIKYVMPKISALSELAEESTIIDNTFYYKYDVKRGLRDKQGKGVLAGLTDISEVVGKKTNAQGESVPCKGVLRYRGIDIKDIVRGFVSENRYGFEETAYLLLFGSLPDKKELGEFQDLLGGLRSLPISFVRDVIMKAPASDMMNGLSRSVLTLYSYDDAADDISIAYNVGYFTGTSPTSSSAFRISCREKLSNPQS